MTDRCTDPEERLLVEAAQREPARFADVYEHYFDRVYAFIARRVQSRDEAQDLTADVFHQALANLSRFEWRGAPFASWLFRIASNAIVDRARRSACRPAGPALIDLAEFPNLAANRSDEDGAARLYELVRRLPADQRRVIELRYIEEKSIREIADELGRTEGAVKQLQFRALKTLRARMGVADG